MGRYSVPSIFFFSPSNLSAALQSGASRPLETLSATARLGEIGTFEATYAYPLNHGAGYVAFGLLEAVGNIAIILYNDWNYPPGAERAKMFGECYIIENVKIEDRAAGGLQVRISGRSFLSELEDKQVWEPIGDSTTYNTELAVAIGAPSSSNSSGSAAAGSTEITVVDASNFYETNTILVPLPGGGTYIGLITNVDGATKKITLDRPLPATIPSNTSITRRPRKVFVKNTTGFEVGAKITITLNSGTFTTIVEEGVKMEDVSGTERARILVRDGITGAAAVNKAVSAINKSKPTTVAYDDINQIIAHASGWSMDTTLFPLSPGSSHVPSGASVFDLLKTVSELRETPFRQEVDALNFRPLRKIKWGLYPSADAYGGNKIMLSNPPPAFMTTHMSQAHRGTILGSITREYRDNKVTRIYPTAGDAGVTLMGVSEAVRTTLAGMGFIIVDSPSALGLYEPPYMYNNALEPGEIIGRAVTFGDITAETSGATTWTYACDRLAWECATWLAAHRRAYWEWRITDIDVSSPVIPRVGTTYHLTRYLDPQMSKTIYTHTWENTDNLIAREITMRWDVARQMPIYDFTLSDVASDPTDAAPALVSRFQNYDMAARRIGEGKAGRAATVIYSAPTPDGGGGGSGSYLPLTGGTMSGNIAFSGTQTVDGVDISAHAANASAHHAPVTAGDNSINVSGQAVSVKRPANSGVKVDATGVLLDPSTLTAATTNAVSGTGHTHAVTATDNAKTTVNTILKGNASGDLTVRNLTADKAVTPRVETSSGALTLAPASSSLAVNAHVAFDGARDITTASGNLTLKPSANLSINPTGNVAELQSATTLKTNHWSSGFLGTGWGVLYNGNADFRSIYADELHVAAFIADTARVKVGSEYITPSMALVSRGFTIPAVSSTGTLYVEDAPGLDNLPVFANEDWVLLRIMNRSGGGLSVQNAWGQVAGYADLANGEQSWTFTTRSAGSAVGQVAQRGSMAMDFGISGDGWLWQTAIDPAGAPYLGITTWQGADPYTDANRSHQIRLGQLSGVTGQSEFGLQVGTTNTNHITLSNLRREFHGTRVSLYAARGGTLQLSAIDVRHYRTISAYSSLVPNEDHLAEGLTSTAGNYWSTIDEGAGSPNHSDYVANMPGSDGVLFVGLTNPTWNGNTVMVTFYAAIKTVNFSGDSVKLYAQVFTADQLTPLSGEVLVYTATSNTTTTVTVGDAARLNNATQAQWNGARLRLRWEYIIGDTAFEAIRLDPNVPSLAVGHPLPTGYEAGGDGFWVGRDAGTYKMRLGKASGVGLRWDGSTLAIRNSDNQNVIEMKSDGTSSFARPMSLGASGGIWQGAGTFASPTSGLKIWNESGVGRLATYKAGTVQVALDSNGQLTSGSGLVVLNNLGIELRAIASATNVIKFIDNYNQKQYGGIYTSAEYNYNTVSFHGKGKDGLTGQLIFWAYNNQDRVTSMWHAGDTSITLDSANTYARLENADFYIKERGLAIGYPSIIPISRGVIATDLAGEHSNPHFVLQDSGAIAHGMTDVASTSTYANFRKMDNDKGGLRINGLSEGDRALDLYGYVTNSNSSTSVGALAPVMVSAYKKSGTDGTALSGSENIFVVRAGSTTRFIVKGNGDFHYDGTGSAYDDHDDVGLLRTLSREMWGGTIDSTWDKFITTNRQNLIDAGIMSDGGFINGAALNRLLTGAIWQLNERLAALEGRAS